MVVESSVKPMLGCKWCGLVWQQIYKPLNSDKCYC